MRVAINQLEALKQKTGIGHYTDQLLRCLRPELATGEIEVYPTGWTARLCKALFARKARGEAQAGSRPSGAREQPLLARLRGWGIQQVRAYGQAALAGHFGRACTRRGYELYHEPNMIPLPCDCPTVITIHDLSLLLYPEWHPAGRVRYFEQRFFAGLKQCHHFLTVSDSIRQQVIRTLAIAPERVTRIYNGIRPGLGPLPSAVVAEALRRLGLPPQYFLYVGTLEPRKNIRMLLRAYCGLPAEVRSEWPLLLVGRWGWNAGDLADYLRREARPRGVLHLGYVAEEHLPVLYGGARALLYPSFYEGFGLPPMEMMACGGAVVASTAAALIETVGSQAQLVPPEDIDGWREALARVVHDDDWWQFLRTGAESVAQPYTWERCAADTLAVYRQLTERKSSPPTISSPPDERAVA